MQQYGALIGIGATLATLMIGGCTGGALINSGKAFSTSYGEASELLTQRRDAAARLSRTAQVIDVYEKRYSKLDTPEGRKRFVAYACDRPNLASIEAPMRALGTINGPVASAAKAPDAELVSLLIAIQGNLDDIHPPKTLTPLDNADVERCRDAVATYLELSLNELPLSTLEDRRGVAQALGGAELLAAYNALLAAKKAAETVLVIVESETRADQLKRYVLDQRTQEAADEAFTALEAIDAKVETLCARHPALCREAGARSGTQRDDAGMIKPTTLHGITILERWSAIRMSWYRYLDMTDPAFEADSPHVDEIAKRRGALDLELSAYYAIPSAPSLAAGMKKSWKELTRLCRGELTPEEAVEAFKAFYANLKATKDALEAIAKAKDDFASAVSTTS